ncbi:hypothetical protein [Aliiroseovarius sp. PrR006]|uniref:hypothetical protein n=1 Tax=Aliiroseovarius sp. PrR006 TaxID=2706883 RepID=UPI0013D2DCA5|nr:hypothetical protein [Aliiroseovarius sp. PrR006]NDW53658.1 hypothetical protein [Aliiroseovarius sp. PrR006]
MMIELTRRERSQIYNAQCDALGLPNDEDAMNARQRGLEAHCWIMTHLNPIAAHEVMRLAQELSDYFNEIGRDLWRVSIKDVKKATGANEQKAIHALELLGAVETGAGVYGNAAPDIVVIPVRLDDVDLTDWMNAA